MALQLSCLPARVKQKIANIAINGSEMRDERKSAKN